jgi:branched-chain amino acid transport system ATP-binding protein
VSEPVLNIVDIKAGYGAAPVLFNVSLAVCAGEIVAIVGSNGAGKTTLLRAISRTIPSEGTLHFDGEDVALASPEHVFARGLVQVPEGRQLFGKMTVEENLMIGSERQKSRAEKATSFERVYSLFPILRDRRHQLAGNLSGGEQQMCALARGLMAAPRLLAVDEMSLGLAPVVVDQLLEVLLGIRQKGVTVLLVEQDVFAAFSVADRGYVMENGRIVREGSAGELSKDENVRRAYVGDLAS